MSALAVDDDILARIGGTPLVRLRRLPGPGSAEVLCKCEQLNPGGSVKDRTALAMVEAGEREGRLIPGRSVIIEATSGNTGIGLALVAAVKGYRLILTMPENMSPERMELLRAYGAELHLTPADRVMRGAVEKAAAIATASAHAFLPQQFKNPVNAIVHRTTTGQEILAQLGDRAPDAFVAGVGTGGTITGVGQVLKPRKPSLRIVAVEPEESPVLSGGQHSPHKIQGIGAGFIPDILDRSVIDEIVKINSSTAIETSRALARNEGIPGGISSGAAIAAALQIGKRPEAAGKTILAIVPSFSERYLSTALFEGI